MVLELWQSTLMIAIFLFVILIVIVAQFYDLKNYITELNKEDK